MNSECMLTWIEWHDLHEIIWNISEIYMKLSENIMYMKLCIWNILYEIICVWRQWREAIEMGEDVIERMQWKSNYKDVRRICCNKLKRYPCQGDFPPSTFASGQIRASHQIHIRICIYISRNEFHEAIQNTPFYAYKRTWKNKSDTPKKYFLPDPEYRGHRCASFQMGKVCRKHFLRIQEPFSKLIAVMRPRKNEFSFKKVRKKEFTKS